MSFGERDTKMEGTRISVQKQVETQKKNQKWQRIVQLCFTCPLTQRIERGVKASKETERKRWRKSRLFVSAPLVARGHGAKQKVCFAINGLSALLEPIDLHAAKEDTYRQEHH
jgi:hypothetical protein